MKLFLDSGAYSAGRAGVKLDVHAYIDFIKEWEHLLDVYVNLDVLDSPEETWKNQKIMEDAGLHPLPVYHGDEDISYLYRCMEYEYFALGGIAGKGVTLRERIAMLDKSWTIICGTPDGMPRNKVHGFGMTSPQLLLRYPWVSVDSSSWVRYSQYAMILIPRRRKGKWDYSRSPHTIKISFRSPLTAYRGKHFNTMTEMEQEVILQYITERGFKLGKSSIREDDGSKLKENEFKIYESDMIEVVEEKGVSNDGAMRDQLNMLYYLELCEAQPPWPWAFKHHKPTTSAIENMLMGGNEDGD